MVQGRPIGGRGYGAQITNGSHTRGRRGRSVKFLGYRSPPVLWLAVMEGEGDQFPDMLDGRMQDAHPFVVHGSPSGGPNAIQSCKPGENRGAIIEPPTDFEDELDWEAPFRCPAIDLTLRQPGRGLQVGSGEQRFLGLFDFEHPPRLSWSKQSGMAFPAGP